ncbi:MBL fold metallo-hydrolase [Paenibacillus sambharensis]|uniref:MBL fold metallo-hydrolase n=1 Tax=Paenibacillus sambharensis TaxID=1803190 RepID=A0A2W1L745_9BACL|nr:MBL fold metallo-hydrolase [Paenibacillus sambharensis]PZD96058.1 MBL fold metallo-hydrolase [Paenibacillus sambharensis]
MNTLSEIKALPLSAPMMGKIETVFPVLVWDEVEAVLIDTGYPGQLSLLKEAAEQAGVPLSRVKHILITHQDLDHIGGLPDLLASHHPDRTVYAQELEVPYIQGEKKLLKLSPEAVEEAVRSLPESVPDEWKEAFRRTLNNPPKAPVHVHLRGGEHLPLCSGLIIIPTPGHTPGHISIYHKATGTLVAGDALTVHNGLLQLPDQRLCSDPAEALKSLLKLTQFPVNTIICYHGGLCTSQAESQLRELAASVR